jgi:arginine decarboxylase
LDRAVASARRLREAIAQMPGLDLMTDAVIGRPGAAHFDPTHVTFDVTGIGLTGYQAADWLRDERGIEFEMSDHRRLMALVTFAHDDQAIDRAVAGLQDLIEERGGGDGSQIPDIPGPTRLRTEQVMRPRDAFFSRDVESVSPGDAPGRLSAEMITPYPPGIPILAPGERITDEIVDYLQQFTAAGGFIEGAADPALESYRVVG